MVLSKVIPDGQGGALVAWYFWLSEPGVPDEGHVTHVSSSGSTDLSISGQVFEMVLGENGTAFANNGAITAFDLSSMTSLWTYQAPAGSNSMKIIASTAGGGLVAKFSDQYGVQETVVRIDSNGQPSTDSWSGENVSYLVVGDWLTGSTSLAAPAADPVELAEATWIDPAGGGNNSSDPGLKLIGSTDCTITDRQVQYFLRNSNRAVPRDANNNVIPYTVFEHQTVHSLAPPDGVTPHQYATDPNSGVPENEFDDAIYPGTGTVPLYSTQTFTYGLKGQRQYRVKRIERHTGDFTWVPIEPPENHILVRPCAEPLINGWPAPYIGQGCENQWPPQ
ncbi:MAG: hypothetical protein LAO04_22705 [Acidobacteriia bacterium]|nr:hypothetical protein [Terriglobia bacterium]